jgi:hypothetical protein
MGNTSAEGACLPACHVVPYENTAKYLDMTLDAKLRWKPHVNKKKGRTRTEIQKNVLANGSLFGPICI